jgi:hypothetical protein
VEISEATLDAAIRKATEAGLFARRRTAAEMAADRELMRGILSAAFEAADQEFMETWPMPRHVSAVPDHPQPQ